MRFDENQKVQDFIQEYLQLCKKHNLCISSTDELYDTDLLRLYTLSDYDYYDFRFDEDGNAIPIYYTFFYSAMRENYDEEYFETMLNNFKGVKI